MANKTLIFGVAGVVALGAVAFLYGVGRDPGPAFIDPSDKQRVVVGKAIYANYCAACHGASLQGQPNWRERQPNDRLPAPPHDKTGHTWHHPDAMLFDMVKNGLVPGKTAPAGYESDMPAYREILTDEEIISVLAYIKSTWPPKVLQAQKEVTVRQSK
ncbi:cytochrome c [Pusillimonas sp. MFBS29]|uniref:c-type cytochrome n=1 Tax=Pusillimonas sp. MFBS29 TaxID=2886690 RepID=UPI001D1083B6|nr:cytochrome c [Pusillimonas sp. MFBS29]MCC2595715.1 cytochrome c [Pusillimonas sp. MFBS29]